MHSPCLTLLQICSSLVFASCYLLSLCLVRFPKICRRTMLTLDSCVFSLVSSHTPALGISWTAIPLVSPSVGHVGLSTPVYGGTCLIVLSSYSFNIPVLGDLILKAFLSQSCIPQQAQGLLTFKNHSSGTQHQLFLLASPSLLFCKSTQCFAPHCSKKEHIKKIPDEVHEFSTFYSTNPSKSLAINNHCLD